VHQRVPSSAALSGAAASGPARLLYIVSAATFFVSHRLPIARAAQSEGFEVHVATPPGTDTATIEAQGIRHHPLSLSRGGMNPWRDLLALLEIVRLLRRLRPQIVHLITPKPILYGGIAARITRVPAVVAAVSGLGQVFAADDLQTRIVRFLVRRAYAVALKGRNLKVIFQNPANRKLLLASTRLSLGDTLLIRGSGVDLREYRRIPEPQGLPVVTFASRLLRAKGVAEFVAAAEQLRADGVAARFLLVGEPDPGNPASIAQGELDAIRSRGIVEVLGHRRDVAQIFSASNLVVLPSYYGEGLPKVLIEAAACGRAIVTTDVPGCRDAIEPGVTGLLVPARDIHALARAIAELLTDSQRRMQMGEAGRALAEREYAIESVVAKHMGIYRSLRAQP
jgi:glycosyltransferase involved in cell wall biosynthesis